MFKMLLWRRLLRHLLKVNFLRRLLRHLLKVNFLRRLLRHLHRFSRLPLPWRRVRVAPKTENGTTRIVRSGQSWSSFTWQERKTHYRPTLKTGYKAAAFSAKNFFDRKQSSLTRGPIRAFISFYDSTYLLPERSYYLPLACSVGDTERCQEFLLAIHIRLYCFVWFRALLYGLHCNTWNR